MPLWEIFIILFVVACCAGFIDSIAGGGGVLTVPALLLSGMDTVSALATNKFQSCFGSGTATFVMARRDVIQVKTVLPFFLASFIGSVMGTYSLQIISSDILNWIVPVLLVIICGYFLFSGGNVEDKARRISDKIYGFAVSPTIGFYDGFFGPGTGSFFTATGSFLRGFNLKKATGWAKAQNFASNLGALSMFAFSGHIDFRFGTIMLFGQILGSRMGSGVVIKGGSKIIRPAIVCVCFVLLGAYVYKKTQA